MKHVKKRYGPVEDHIILRRHARRLYVAFRLCVCFAMDSKTDEFSIGIDPRFGMHTERVARFARCRTHPQLS